MDRTCISVGMDVDLWRRIDSFAKDHCVERSTLIRNVMIWFLNSHDAGVPFIPVYLDFGCEFFVCRS